MVFNIDFELAYRQAAEMEQIADEIMHQHRNVMKLIGTVRQIWRGNVSNEYIGRLDTLAQKLAGDSQGYRNDAIAFRAAVDAIRKAAEAAERAIAENSIRQSINKG